MTILHTFKTFLNFQGSCKQNFRTFLPFAMLKKKSDHIYLVIATTSQNRPQLLSETTALETDDSEEEHWYCEDQLVLVGAKGSSDVGNQEAHDPPLS